jgi:hypothetical protein
MGQDNSRRISHDIDNKPNTFRDDQLRQIIDDIDEEISGKGYSEVLRSGVFVSEIKIWSEPTNNPSPNPNAKLRTIEVFTRTGVFITSSVKGYYDESEVIIATATTTYVRAVNNQIVSTNTIIARI